MRARNIKPGWVDNTILGTCDPYIQILFGALPMLADKEGRLKDDPLWVKGKIFPYRESLDTHGYLTFLYQHHFICRYEAAGERYIQIIKFKEHQSPHKTEKPSKIPPPVNPPLPNGEYPTDSLFTDSLIQEEATHTTPVSDFQQIFDAGCAINHALEAKSTAVIHQWLADGVTPRDAVPEVKRLAAKARGWDYFTGAVLDAKATRETPLPKGNPHENASRNFTKPNKDERSKTAVIDGIQQYRDSLIQQ